MFKNILRSIILVLLTIALMACSQNVEKKNVLEKDELSTVIPTPVDYSQGAFIEIKSPSAIAEWVGEVFEMTMVQNFAYISTSNYGLQILDLSDPTNPSGVASIYFYTKLPNKYTPSSFFLSGNQLYVGAGCTGGMLFILDVMQPAKPSLLDAHSITCSGKIIVEGDKAYIANHYSGLLILDVSDPSDVREYGTVSIAEILNITFGYRQSVPPVLSLAMNKNIFWIVVNGFEPSILQINTSNSSQIAMGRKTSGRPISGYYTYRPYQQLGDTIYLPSATGIDIQRIEFNSAQSQWLNFEELLLPPLTRTPAFRITPQRLYLMSPEIGLKIVGYGDTDRFELIQNYHPQDFKFEQMYVHEDRLIFVSGKQSFQLLNIDQNTEISVLFSFP